MAEFELIVKDINDKLTALGEQVSEQRLAAIVQTVVDAKLSEPEFLRKMRFGGSPKLDGSKYARFGMNEGDIEFMHQLLSAAKVRGMSSGPSQDLENAFRATTRGYYGLPDDDFDGKRTRAMDTGTSTEGSQLVGAQYVGDLWDAARNESRVAALIPSFEMTAPVAYVPVEVNFPTMYRFAESTSSTITALTTSETNTHRVTMTAYKLGIHQIWSGEMEEDSIIAFVPFLRSQAAKSMAYYMDAIALNGDQTTTNGINGIDDTLTTAHYSYAPDGIRHGGLVGNTSNSVSAANAAVSLALFKPIYGRMIDVTYKQDWGHPNNPADLVHVVDPYVADGMMVLDEFLTADKAGNQATNVNGQISKVFGHPVVSSIALRKTTNNGYVDDDTEGNNVYGQIVTFNRNACKFGWRRRVKVEVEREAQSDQSRIVYSFRLGFSVFSPTGAATGIEGVDTVYYIAV